MRLGKFVLVLLATGSPAFADSIGSNFNTSEDGWSAGFGADRSTFAVYQSSGGNPGGFIRAADRISSVPNTTPWTFESFDKFDGDRSAYVGGTLTFDIKSFSSTAGSRIDDADVKLSGNSMVLTYDGDLLPTAAWTNISIPLTASAWRIGSSAIAPTEAQFAAVLAHLTDLQVRGGYTGGFDDTGLDNVFLNAPAAPASAPLPSAAASGLALCSLAAWMRKRRATTTL